jgi:galactose mutarotase-like enzyme
VAAAGGAGHPGPAAAAAEEAQASYVHAGQIRKQRPDACGTAGPLRIRWNDIELTMTSSPNVTHAVIYTPHHAVCVEPQTCAPDAFNLAAQGVPDAGMAIVDDRHPLIATTTWRWTIGEG